MRRALAVLGAFTDQSPEWGLADLSRSLHLTKSTTLRLLGALEREGLLSRFGPNGSYRLGPTAIELGARAQRVHSLPGTAHAELLRLARATGETTSLEVLIGNEILILDEVLGTHLVGRSSSIGTRWPAHAASTGKVLLAAARQGNVETWQGAPLDSPLELEQYTPRTITSRHKVRRRAESSREAGIRHGHRRARGWVCRDRCPDPQQRPARRRGDLCRRPREPAHRGENPRSRGRVAPIGRSNLPATRGPLVSDRSLSLALVGLVLLATLPALRPAPAAGGHLLIVGGGEQPPELVSHFVELAGGSGKAKIAVVPMASSEPVETGKEKADELVGLGARVMVLNLNHDEAMSDSVAHLLDDVTGVWFTGEIRPGSPRSCSGPRLFARSRRCGSGAASSAARRPVPRSCRTR